MTATAQARATSGISERMAERGHEQVVFVGDAASGLRAIIAVHSTALGPALGGVRFWHYPGGEEEALGDVLRLSEAMTMKAAVAGLHQGGGKAVVMLPSADAVHSEAMLTALGRAIDELGGRYLAAEDVGATPHDMDVLARETRWVTGVDPAAGGSGDPSPVTAIGVRAAMEAVMEALDGDPSLAGTRVAVQGVGHVGASLVGLLVEAGAEVVLGDVDVVQAESVAAAHGVAVVAADEVLAVDCDIFAPCALGAVLTTASIDRLSCRAVCGAANNQLAEPSIAEELGDRGVLYAPDYVANAGGIINLAEEFTSSAGYSRARALAAAEGIGDTMRRVLARARDEGVSPHRIAEAMAHERIATEGTGPWRPGDPTAWTNGQPLLRLRPEGT